MLNDSSGIQDDSALPDRIADHFRSLIASGALKPGTRLANEPDLAKSLNVSRATLRVALARLASRGLLVRKRGVGTFVAKDPLVTNNLGINAGVTQVLRSMGVRVGTSSLSLSIEKASAATAASLELEVGAPVLVVERVRTANERPVILSYDIVPSNQLSRSKQSFSLDSLRQLLGRRQSLYAVLGTLIDLQIDHGIAELRPIVADRQMAAKLDVPIGSALLHIEQVDYDPSGKPVMRSDEYHTANAFAFTVYREGGPTLTVPAAQDEEFWEEGRTIRIGVPTPITGYGASMGADILAGISMAVEKVNAAGGVLGKPLEMIIADIEESGMESCRLAAELMDKAGVVAIFPGGFFGSEFIHVFGKYDPPLLHASAEEEAVEAVVTNLPQYRNIFQLSASEESFGINAVKVLVGELPIEYANNKVALLGGHLGYDRQIKASARRMFENEGWQVIMDETYSYGTTDFEAQVAEIRSKEPGIIFGCLTSVNTSVAFINQFLASPTNSILFVQWSPAAAEFKELLGEKANGIVWQTEYGYLPSPENLAWVEEFKVRFGRAPGKAWPAMMEDMLHIWKRAVEWCGCPTDYACICQYIESLSDHPFVGRLGRYGMNRERHEGLTGDDWLPIHFYQVQGHDDLLLFLGTRAVGANRFQIPPWFA